MLSDSRSSQKPVFVMLLWLVTISVTGSGCTESLGTTLQADQDQTKATAITPRKANRPVSMDFELPDEFWKKDSTGRDLVTGFRVGYFKPGETAPLFTNEVGRDAIVVSGKTGRLALNARQFPSGVNEVEVRLQTMTSAASSPWSEPSARLAAAPAAPARNASKNPSRKGRPSVDDLESYPRLAEVVKKTLSPDANREVLGFYRTLEELATAALVSRDAGIPLDKLTQHMAGPPRRSLRNAVRDLKPSARGALQKARADAKQLLEKAPPQ